MQIYGRVFRVSGAKTPAEQLFMQYEACSVAGFFNSDDVFDEIIPRQAAA